jgi:crotonobetainyl-CoA:carnitine CoA-transferase CaiB-like acyl-CoA transferase
MDEICSDLVVIELGNGSAAASEAGMFLADNGARVIKVESPQGDLFRDALPTGWLVWNRGKESLVADVRGEAGQQTVRDLIVGADVVIEAYDAGRAGQWGLAFDEVRSTNPGLIYCSIKGFGLSGAYSGIPAYDALVMAKAGAFCRGDFGFRPGPIFSGARIASNGAAHMAVSGILAALIVRDRTGVGQRVDTSLYLGLNPIDYFVSYHVQLGQKAAPAAGGSPAPGPERGAPAATRYMVSASTRDGRWLFFSPQLPHQAKALIKVLELDSMLKDARFVDMPAFATLDDAAAWEDAIYERIKERDLAEWVERALASDDLPFEPVLSAEEALDHPQLRANANVVTIEDHTVGPVEQIGPVATFSRTPSVIDRSAPQLDDHQDPPPPKPKMANTGPLPRYALEGVTILEFGYFYAMPFGVTMAGALGARVIKVESIEGDPMRWSFGPPEWGALKTMEGKESICLNLRTEGGRQIMQDLLRQADVFVQGFRPGVDARLGVDYETAKALNPNVVYVHGAGYGSSGPYAHRPIYAGTAASGAGSVHRQAAYWLDPELNKTLDAASSQAVVAPRMRNQTDGDANAAVGVLSAILFGLRHRQRTGEGQFVGTSMLGGNALAYADDFNRYEGKQPVPQADPEQLGLSATYRLYEAQEGWIFLAVPSQEEWQLAMTAAGRTDLVEDPRFTSPADRTTHDGELATELEALFRTRPAGEWEEAILGAGAGCVMVSERSQAETAVCDAHLREMGLVGEIEHPSFGRLLRYAAPAALSATPGRLAPGCVIAQHTETILGELGYTEDEIAKLAADGAVRLAD